MLALVSEFNCFLRSRCSMEVWSPDNIGRDSWDWVGPPAWGRARFNSPEWGGGSAPVKTEPPQIVLLLLFGRIYECVYVHSTTVMNWQTRWSPQALTAVSARKLEKLALNSGTTGGARKMTQNASKTHSPPHNASNKELRTSLLYNKMSTTLAVN